MAGHNRWPYADVPIKVVGWAVRDRAQLQWNDNSVDIYVNDIRENAPQCAEGCGRFFNRNGTYPRCPGGVARHYDQSLWLTAGFGGGAGGDWGQRIGSEYFMGNLNSSERDILLHEIGHTFGLDDFYDWTPTGVGGFIMKAGSSSVITEFDKWMFRDWWRHLKNRYGSDLRAPPAPPRRGHPLRKVMRHAHSLSSHRAARGCTGSRVDDDRRAGGPCCGTPGLRHVRRPVPARRRPPAAGTVPGQHRPHPRVPEVPRPRPAAAHVPPQRRTVLDGGPVWRVGVADHRAARPLDRARADRAGAGVREHRRHRVLGQGRLPGRAARAVPGAGQDRRVQHRLPVGVPGELHRPGGGRANRSGRRTTRCTRSWPVCSTCTCSPATPRR